MAYIDAQDLARERAAQIRQEQKAAHTERVAELNDLQQRGRGLFKDPARLALDQLVKADLETHGGYHRPADIAEAQEEAWAALRPIIHEVQGKPLSTAALKEIVGGVRRGKVSDERVDQLVDLIVSGRTGVYETKAARTAELAAMNRDLAKERPLLNALLKATGAGNSVALARELLAERAETTVAAQRAATASRPFAGLVERPPGVGVAPPAGKLWPLLPVGGKR